MNDVDLLIYSCRAYSDLWSNQFLLLDKYWPTHPRTVLLSDGFGIYNVAKVDDMFVYDLDCSARLIEAVKNIANDYIFITFDDYYLCKKINVNYLNSIIDYVKANRIDYCGFFRNRKAGNKKIKHTKLIRLALNKPYEINLYMSLWKRESLLKCLIQGEDIWKSEVRLTSRAKKHNLVACCLTKKIFTFKDVVRKGKYTRSAYRYLKKHNLFMSDREKRTVTETIGLFFKTFFSKASPNFLKGFLKKMYRLTGHKIYSDYEEDNQ